MQIFEWLVSIPAVMILISFFRQCELRLCRTPNILMIVDGCWPRKPASEVVLPSRPSGSTRHSEDHLACRP